MGRRRRAGTQGQRELALGALEVPREALEAARRVCRLALPLEEALASRTGLAVALRQVAINRVRSHGRNG